MSSLDKELVCLVLKFLEEKQFKETVHRLEKESGVFFNLSYFEESVMNGDWDEVEGYLSGFTKTGDNHYSMKIFFMIREQKYSEALIKRDYDQAVEVLTKDLEGLAIFTEERFKEMAMLALGKFRENEQLAKYEDIKSARSMLFNELKRLIVANPLIGNKLQFPSLHNLKLGKLVNMRQQQQPNWPQAPSPVTNQLMSPMRNVIGLPTQGAHNLFLPAHAPAPAPLTSSLGGWMANSSSVPKLATSGLGLCASSSDYEHILNRRCFGISVAKPGIREVVDKFKNIWQETEFNEPSQIRSLRLPDTLLSVTIPGLIYTKCGSAIVALTYHGQHKLWKWQRHEQNLKGKATTTMGPELCQPSSGILMVNDIIDLNVEDAFPCFALSKNDSYLVSATGGKISLFSMITLESVINFKEPPPAATFLAFDPEDNNIIAIGMDDSSIEIYDVWFHQVIAKLKGHRKRVTGLAFCNVRNIIVSSGADAQLCVWSMNTWEKLNYRILHGREANPWGRTHVHFDKDETHLLVVHETHLAIYLAPELDWITQWDPRQSSGAITDAVYSCDSESVYASLEDGSLFILYANSLGVRCCISPTAYLPPNLSLRVHPVVIAAHPSEPDQFAVGLTEGGVIVLELPESWRKW